MDKEYAKYQRWKEYDKSDFTEKELAELNRMRNKFEGSPSSKKSKKKKNKHKSRKRGSGQVGKALRGFGDWSRNVQDSLFNTSQFNYGGFD